MRVAAISDTHLPRGGRRLPEACLEQLHQADLILHAGDLSHASFLDELRSFGPPVYAVHGNADEPELRASLPGELVVAASGARIALIHDAGPRAGREERLATRFDGCDAVLYGHSHMPQAERCKGIWILNPGSPTERRRGPFHSLLVLEIEVDGTISPELIRLS